MSFLIILIFLVILFISIKEKNQIFHKKHKELNVNQTSLYKSLDNVDEKIKDLERIFRTHLYDAPKEDVELLESIIEEWLEIQKNSRLDIRSWVRNKKKLNK